MSRKGILCVVILAAGYAAMLALNWPGQLSYDSISQLADGREGIFRSWHPPVMALLLGIFDRAFSGPGLFIAANGAMALFAFLVFLRPARATWLSLVLVLLVVLTPQWLLYQGIVWKDVLFADAALAGFAALALAAQGRQTWVWMALAALLLILAAMTRQNGLVILPFAAVLAGCIAGRGGRHGRAFLCGMVFFGLTLLGTLGLNAALLARGDHGADAAEEMRLAQAYDLTGMLRRDPNLSLTRLEQDAPRLASLLKSRGVSLYTPERIDPVQDDEAIHLAVNAAAEGTIFAAWRDAILEHPATYLGARWAVFRTMLAPQDRLACRPLFTGVDGPAPLMASLDLHPRWRLQEKWHNRYGLALVDTPLLSHLAFGVLAAGLLLLFLLRRRPADMAASCLLGAAMAFTASYFVIGVACDYRYLYFLDMAAMAAALHGCRRHT